MGLGKPWSDISGDSNEEISLPDEKREKTGWIEYEVCGCCRRGLTSRGVYLSGERVLFDGMKLDYGSVPVGL